MYKTIVITGGAGFVGSNLAYKIKQKYPATSVVIFDNLKRRGSELNISRLEKKGIVFLHGDIRNKEDIASLPPYDLIIECSAEPSVLAGTDSSPEYLLNTNLSGTLNCLESARKYQAKIIFLSTSRVYPIEAIAKIEMTEKESRFVPQIKKEIQGLSDKGISEKFPLDGARSLYGATKLCSELIMQEYMHTFGVESIINRCGVISGPWQMGKVDQGFMVLWVAKHIYNGRLSYIGYGGEGKQVRDVLHIDDLFELIDVQMSDFKSFSGQTFNVGGGVENSISLLELTHICQKMTKKEIEIKKIPTTRPNDIPWYVTDSSKVTILSGWKPKKNIETIVKDIADWILENKESLRSIIS